MNKLAVRPNGTALAHPVEDKQEDPIASLPYWLQYLIGAYATSKTSSRQFGVMEDQFLDYDHDLLADAAREFVRSDRRDYHGFPTAPEFRKVVEQVQAQQEEQERETKVTAFDEWFERCQVLRVQRLDLLEDWYTGAVTGHQLSRFADELHAAGLESAAANLRGKLQ